VAQSSIFLPFDPQPDHLHRTIGSGVVELVGIKLYKSFMENEPATVEGEIFPQQFSAIQ